MAGGTKEDEKNERIIRRLLKLSENKRCINCNSLGPQYVCATFWSFVCTNCSGIHREFTHRVKSISMAKFTSEEVNALQQGGNQRAKDIYFKGLDQERQSGLDSSNLEALRNFIRQVYVNKRYTGEKNDGKPPRGQMGDQNDYNERRSSGGRSPGFEPDSKRLGKSNKSPSRPEFVNDWRREDRFGSARKSEEGIHSPEQVKDIGSSSHPAVRPVSEILGDNVIPLRVGEPPKPHVNPNADASAYAKRAPSSDSLTSTNENPPEVKLEITVSLIDFDADPEPPGPAVAVHALQSITPQPAAQPATTANDNWAFFDAASTAPSVIVSQSPPSGNTVDSLLSQLAMPSSMPIQTSSLASGPLASMDITNVHQLSPSLLPVHLGHSTSQNFAQPHNGPSTEQPWNTAFASNVPREASPLPLEGLQSSGRSELSADLFAVTYPSYNAAEPRWQVGPPHGMHFGMQQYNNTVQPFQNFPQPAKSMNPFDFSSEPPSKTQTETLFPSMASLQGTVPNTLPPLDMMPSQGLHNPSSLPPQVPGLTSAMPPRYISPQMPGTMPLSNIGASYDTQQTSYLTGNPFG